MLVLAAIALACWILVLLVPWAPWLCRERLEADGAAGMDRPPVRDSVPPARDFTVLIPARDEAPVIGATLAALAAAAPGAPVIVVDDGSADGTGDVARAAGLPNLTVLEGAPPPAGWTGKLWALQQALARAATPRVLLLDADIRLAPGLAAALRRQADAGFALVSVYAEPDWGGAAARWLMPAFVYFFKLLYPFALANRPGARVAAAAGGVMLVDRAALVEAGGFAAWRSAIIDDCTLAQHLKRRGHRCWVGLTRGAVSQRHAELRDLGHMIARTAFVQLRQSLWLTLAASVALVVTFWIPVLALGGAAGESARLLGLLAFLAMLASYLPTLLYYGRNPLFAILLPLAATFFLGAMWYSAWRGFAGTRAVWKGRRYPHGSA